MIDSTMTANSSQSQENDFETYFDRPEKTGNSSIRIIDLGEGLKLVLEKYQLVSKQVSEFEVAPLFLSFAFCISGKSRCTVQDVKKEFITTPGQNYLGFCPDPSGGFKCLSEEPVSFISVFVSPSFLNKLMRGQPIRFPGDFVNIMNGCNDVFYSQEGINTGPMQMTIHQILNCPYQGVLRRVYLESKAMELITLKLAQLTCDNTCLRKNRLTAKEIECIHQAGEILIDNMKNPPSLTDLSRQVGLNDKKLKYGFKQVFNTTAFGYLRSHRMEMGRQFLANGELNISEISYEVGYSERPHFTRAFTKHFGCSPLSYLHSKN